MTQWFLIPFQIGVIFFQRMDSREGKMRMPSTSSSFAEGFPASSSMVLTGEGIERPGIGKGVTVGDSFQDPPKHLQQLGKESRWWFEVGEMRKVFAEQGLVISSPEQICAPYWVLKRGQWWGHSSEQAKLIGGQGGIIVKIRDCFLTELGQGSGWRGTFINSYSFIQFHPFPFRTYHFWQC